MKKVVGLGAGGHAKVLLDILKQGDSFEVIALTDTRKELHNTDVSGIKVIGDDEQLPELYRKGIRYAFIGVGGVQDNIRRTEVFKKAISIGFEVINIIHPSAVIADSVSLGRGVAIMAGAILNSDTVIGNNVIINTGAIVEHDCLIKDNVHICPGAKMAGNVTVEESSTLGIGCVVIQGINIGKNCLVGAGSVVLNDVPDNTIVVGSPAKAIEQVEVQE